MHVEEKEFTLRLELRCSFPDDYEGEEDGYQWAAELPSMASSVLAAAVQALSRYPGWKLRPRNRGRSTEDEVTLVVERDAR